MKARLGILAGLTVAALSTAANAAIIATVTPVNPPLTNSFGETVTGYSAFILSLSGTSGEMVAAVNAGGAGTTGITGPLLQMWDYAATAKSTSYFPTPTEFGTSGQGSLGGLNGQDYGLDSHFLLNPTQLAVVNAPNEDNAAKHNTPATYAANTPGDDGADVWGMGSFLTMNAGIAGPFQSSSVQIAYVIIPTGQSAHYDLQVSDAVGNVTALSGNISGVPEPASLGMLAMGGAALLVRRKKA
jgi:hypothetical protein